MVNEQSYICSIDQGTSSTRCIIYDKNGKQVISKQQEFDIICKEPGWAEQDPFVILNSVLDCVREAITQGKINVADIKGVGITNQRETTVLWDKTTGKPLYNALLWLDTRNSKIVDDLTNEKCEGDKDFLRSKCGLPISTYFSATKISWLINNVQEVKDAIKKGNCLFGTVDSWLIWNLTDHIHVTDVTNASRTMLMNIETRKWDESLCEFFGVPSILLPAIKSSSEEFGIIANGELKGVPISGVLGDQQAALVGQFCLKPGEAKNTYGTGCFMLFNTGERLVQSSSGLLTTVGYQFGPDKPVIYALEGSIAIAGAGVKWLKNNLGIISTPSDMDVLSSAVEDTGGVYFVPAFSGLFAPYWRDDAKGVITGLTQYSNKNHIARALLEATAFQTKEILEAMEKDSGVHLQKLKVDGGMSNSKVLLQIQSDLLNIPVIKPSNIEATAFGAAFAAGVAVGVYSLDHFAWDDTLDAESYQPQMEQNEREKKFEGWKKAVTKSFNL